MPAIFLTTETHLEWALRLARDGQHGPPGTKVLAEEIDRLRSALEEAAKVLAAEQSKEDGISDLLAPDLDVSWVPENQSWRVYLGDIETATLIAWVEPADLEQYRGKGYCNRREGWDVEVCETELGKALEKGHVETARGGVKKAIEMLRAATEKAL